MSTDDVVMDLGSGLGHAPLLVALCTQARAIGIEREAAYLLRARLCAFSSNARRAEFILQDARDADFSIGTVFYLYTPFTGCVLRAVPHALRHEAGHRAIRVCTYGPCTNVVAHEPWLDTIETVRADRLAVFRSRRAGPANP